MGLLQLASGHGILPSGFLGQNCTSVSKNNHWLGKTKGHCMFYE